MIVVLGFATIIIFLYVTMTKKLSIQSALIGIPVIAAIIGGFGFDIGKMMIAGVIKVTPSAMIPIFAVIYFGIMIDAGLFDPMVNRILKLVKGDPVKITLVRRFWQCLFRWTAMVQPLLLFPFLPCCRLPLN